MPVDVSVPESAGWWLAYLSNRLRKRQLDMEVLTLHYAGNPPLPAHLQAAQPAIRDFHRKARSNFAALVIAAVLERLRVRAIRTAADSDDDGDAQAAALFKANRMNLALNDALRWALLYGESYLSVAAPSGATGEFSTILPEHPGQCIAVSSALRPHVASAAMKMFHDEATGTDWAYLWLEGQAGGNAELHVAKRARRATAVTVARTPVFSPGQFEWDEELSVTLSTPRVPLVILRNPDGVGELTPHLDVLDRINYMLLQRLQIATLQAFKQRAVIQDLPDTDDSGAPIDYDAIFTSDPGALWRLPLGTSMWESSQADLTPMLTSVRDDVLHLAAVTRTPLSMFTPDAVNNTAEGASLAREGNTFKVEDRQLRFGESVALATSLAFELQGDTDRAELQSLSVDWAPAERFSLQEKATAAVAATTAGMPWRARATQVWQLPPEEVLRQEAMRLEDMALAPAQAQNTATTQATGQDASTRAAAGVAARAVATQTVANAASTGG